MAAFPILVLAFCDVARALSVSGVIARLKREMPQARITLATTPIIASLFEDDDSIAEIQALDGAIFNLRSLGSLTELSRRRWGLCIDLGPSMLARMMKAKLRFSFNPNDSEPLLRQMCAHLNLPEAEVLPSLRISPVRRAKAQALAGKGPPYIVMAPGAGWIGRRWPTERFAVLATRLVGPGGLFAGRRLVVLGAPSARDTLMAMSLATTRAQVVICDPERDALTACAVLRDAGLFVGNDEIWLQLAGAAGIPTIGLYGPSDTAGAPPGPHVQAVRGPRTLEDIRRDDPKLKQNICHMLDLPVERVYEAITKLMPGPQEIFDAPDL
jgi:ADP-heptose:LPS heptosyltransferase